MTKEVDKKAEPEKPEEEKKPSVLRLTSTVRARKSLARIMNEYRQKPDKERDTVVKSFRAQVYAFGVLLDYFRVVEMEELAGRLEELEEAVAKGDQ